MPAHTYYEITATVTVTVTGTGALGVVAQRVCEFTTTGVTTPTTDTGLREPINVAVARAAAGVDALAEAVDTNERRRAAGRAAKPGLRPVPDPHAPM